LVDISQLVGLINDNNIIVSMVALAGTVPPGSIDPTSRWQTSTLLQAITVRPPW